MSSLNPSEQIELAVDAVQRFSRRDFLKLAVGSAGLAATGFLPASAAAGIPKDIRFMGDAEFKVFQRLAQVTLPVNGTKFAPLSAIPVMQTLDAALLGGMAPHELQGLKAGVKLFEDAPLKTYGKPFSKLGDKQAAAFCDAWGNSADALERGLVTALKKLVTLSYWANPPTWAALGYDGPVSKKWGLPPLGNAPMPSE
ncbi:MAG: hypothetical protein KGZ83_15925 [Sulfuricella sp.]|nr:hypothetical protein [Sulfuricella sp.]